MQPLKLLLAVALPIHVAPPFLLGLSVPLYRTLCHPAELARPKGCPRPSSSVGSHIHTHFPTSLGPPRGSAPQGQFQLEDSDRKQRGVLPTPESPGWASSDPSHPSGKPPSFLFCCLVLRENSTCSQNRKLSPAPAKTQPQPHTSVYCPFRGGPRAFSCHPLSSSLAGATCLPLSG